MSYSDNTSIASNVVDPPVRQQGGNGGLVWSVSARSADLPCQSLVRFDPSQSAIEDQSMDQMLHGNHA